MNLRRFMNVAYYLLVEEYQRMGVGLIDALDRVSEWGKGGAVPTSPSPQVSATQNTQNMEMLQSMLAGKSNHPLARKPRRA